jgi:hypothetical protein
MDGETEMSSRNTRSPVAKPDASRLPPHPQPHDPKHGEWLIDEASDESFPASDPSSITQPHHQPGKPKGAAVLPACDAFVVAWDPRALDCSAGG